MNIQGINSQFNKLNRINILLGKNGVGKSTILKGLGNRNRPDAANSHILYITPERGGFLKYSSAIENNVTNSPHWITDTRLNNQFTNFKEQTIYRYQSLEMQILRAVEQTAISNAKGQNNDFSFFKTYIDKINKLLENIEVRRDTAGKSFKVFKQGTDSEINTESISSGESELISLAIECFFFQHENSNGKPKILLLDEPDVHLHPDLQVRFMRFIHEIATEPGKEFTVIIATHSTAFLGAIEDTTNLSVCFTTAGQTTLNFMPVTDAFRSFLPVFGAHPLSNIFNQSPVLLVEGEDDERIWQQAVRTSAGKIKVFPVVCGSVNDIHTYEVEVSSVLNSVYDNAKAYSIRDRDANEAQDLADEPPIIKHRTHCYSMENLLLSNEILASLHFTWAQLQQSIADWIAANTEQGHAQLKDMIAFRDEGFNRKNVKIKSLRVLLVGIMGSTKPWEVIVGQQLAALRWQDNTDYTEEGSIFNYLGKKLVESLLLKQA